MFLGALISATVIIRGPRTVRIQSYFWMNASWMTSFKSENQILSQGDWFISLRVGIPLLSLDSRYLFYFVFMEVGTN